MRSWWWCSAVWPTIQQFFVTVTVMERYLTLMTAITANTDHYWWLVTQFSVIVIIFSCDFVWAMTETMFRQADTTHPKSPIL